MQSRYFLLLLICLVSCTSRYVHHERTTIPVVTPPEQVKVALVLGGGGARGMAHLGVLEELEKRGFGRTTWWGAVRVALLALFTAPTLM